MNPSSADSGEYRISVVIATYNRSRDLAGALHSVLHQEGEIPYEVLVVDNNSNDDTRSIVESLVGASAVPLRYFFEPGQGVSNGRNLGIRNARAPLVAFTDDDCRPAPNWIASISETFDRHPEVDCIGGRVAARWRNPIPDWFNPRQRSPLALCEHGDHEFVVDVGNAATCLLTANLTCRRSAFDKAGLFSPHYPRGQDREIQLRLWRAGCRGLYSPAVMVWVDIPPHRLTRKYFREWYRTYGEVHARMRLLEVLDRDGRLLETPPTGGFFGTSPYVYRKLGSALLSWALARVRRQSAEAFYQENRIVYLRNYVRTCFVADRRANQTSIVSELMRFVSTRVSSVLAGPRRGTTRVAATGPIETSQPAPVGAGAPSEVEERNNLSVARPVDNN